MMTTGTPRMGTQDPPWMRRGLIAVAVLFLSVVLVAPLALVFHGAFEKGWGVFAGALADPDTLAALGLTLTAAAASVAVNTVFGVAALEVDAVDPSAALRGQSCEDRRIRPEQCPHGARPAHGIALRFHVRAGAYPYGNVAAYVTSGI